jgi:hypothetical protein
VLLPVAVIVCVIGTPVAPLAGRVEITAGTVPIVKLHTKLPAGEPPVRSFAGVVIVTVNKVLRKNGRRRKRRSGPCVSHRPCYGSGSWPSQRECCSVDRCGVYGLAKRSGDCRVHGHSSSAIYGGRRNNKRRRGAQRLFPPASSYRASHQERQNSYLSQRNLRHQLLLFHRRLAFPCGCIDTSRRRVE